LLGEYLDAISTQDYVERADSIASTRNELDLSMRIARIEGLPPTGDSQLFYLPFVDK
jgi:hypothetical protein